MRVEKDLSLLPVLLEKRKDVVTGNRLLGAGKRRSTVMLWHDGSIREAVDKVKLSDVILLVFIYGEDSLSKKYETYLSSETKFKDEDYVAVAVDQNSQEFRQFKQIYVSVPVPSVFVIESNGKPLNVISSCETSDIFNSVYNAMKKKKNNPKKANLHKNGDVTSEDNKLYLEEKKKKYCHHLSNVGRKLFDVSEEEIKKRLKEIRAFPKFLHLDTPSLSDQDITFPPFGSSPKKQSARIQFRLPNNEMPSWEFPNLSTLGDVKAYISEKMGLSPNFKLLRTYPGTVFTSQDEKKTLTELNLTPNATLILIPVQDVTVQAKIKSMITQQSFASAVFRKLMEPIFIILNYFKKYILRQPEENKISPKKFPSDTSAEKVFNKKTSTSNIHGFNFLEDSDSDTDNPDNGNSTQQRFKKKK